MSQVINRMPTPPFLTRKNHYPCESPAAQIALDLHGVTCAAWGGYTCLSVFEITRSQLFDTAIKAEVSASSMSSLGTMLRGYLVFDGALCRCRNSAAT